MTPPAIVHPGKRDIGWAAGLLEGEGSFYGNGNSERVSIQMTDSEPLVRLREYFGGPDVRVVKRKDRIPARKVCYAWECNGTRARGLMMTLYALLSPRRRAQIRLALGIE